MPKTAIRLVTLAALLVGAASFSALPAAAAPTVRDIVVEQCPSGNATCDQPSPIEDGDVASEKVKVQLQATSNQGLGLRWVQLDGRAGTSGTWTCFRRWSFESNSNKPPSWTGFYFWTTKSFPREDQASGCPAGSGGAWDERTLNGIHELRFTAKDQIDGSERSKTFAIDLSNAPAVPSWAAAPRVIGNETSSPRVELTWNTRSDDGVVEYHIVRNGPDGTKGFQVKASSPGGQGCTSGGSSITCTDDSFDATYGGNYDYTLYAARTTSATSGANVVPCAFSTGRCIMSGKSDSQRAQMKDPPEPTPTASPSGPPSSSPTPTSGGGNGSSGSSRPRTSSSPRVLAESSTRDYSQFYEGTYEESLPFDQHAGFRGPTGPVYGGLEPDQALGAGTQGFFPTDRDPTPYRAAAGGLLMVLVALHMARYLRHSRA